MLAEILAAIVLTAVEDLFTFCNVTLAAVKILRERLEGRGTDSAEVIEKRMSMAEKRIKEAKFYDYVVINDDLDRAVEQVKAIIEATRLEYKNLCGLNEFINKVLDVK